MSYCLVPFHAILAEITVLKRKQTLLERPRISWKGPIRTNWITITIFSRLLFQLLGWFDEVMHALFWVHTLLKEISTRENHTPTTLYTERLHVVFTISIGMTCGGSKWTAITDPIFFRLYDFTLHLCWGTCICCLADE